MPTDAAELIHNSYRGFLCPYTGYLIRKGLNPRRFHLKNIDDTVIDVDAVEDILLEVVLLIERQ